MRVTSAISAGSSVARKVRALVILGLGALVALLVQGAIGSARADPPTEVRAFVVDCHTLIVRDGTEAARLSVTCSGRVPVFSLLGDGNVVRASFRLRMEGDDPVLEVLDAKRQVEWASPTKVEATAGERSPR